MVFAAVFGQSGYAHGLNSGGYRPGPTSGFRNARKPCKLGTHMASISQNKKRSSTLLFVAGLGAVAIVIVWIVVLDWRAERAIDHSFGWVRHTLEVERELSAIQASLADAETAQRGFLLTGTDSYLKPYTDAQRDLPVSMRDVAALVSDNPNQQRRIRSLSVLTRDKLAELDSTIRLARAGQRSAALRLVESNFGEALMIKIRGTIFNALREEESLLADRQEALAEATHTRRALALGLVVALGILLAGIGVALRRVRAYENLVTLCAWSKTVSYEGEWMSFEEYLRRRFDLTASHGISPEAMAQFESPPQSVKG
jgi:CHASE3 domain sensor protein